jgi:DNA-binding MarR family transcriptional regulator
MATPKRVLLQFRVIANAVRSPVRPVHARQAVPDRQLLALSAIARAPGMRVRDLAQALGVRQPTASQVVKALLARQLVTVERDGGDRRAVRIHVHAHGLAVLQVLPESFDFGDRLPEALARLDASALRSLEAGLSELTLALSRSAAALGTASTGPSGVLHEQRHGEVRSDAAQGAPMLPS